ncbi:hypothetical protein [Endozoicomonas sp. 8E]|uniref:hypothetical protein n=1 Tax=Endozoicomonas sp. 8E TaxID=3035692 RepID=UPI002938D4C7|nr:hypothetical protein [Endozoicomonas sp. 8E]WOG29395.1 hypothetical protein P6910_07030 [Endozoicomonas sp. 8E]
MSTVVGSVGGQSPVNTGQQVSQGVEEGAKIKAQGMNRSIEARNHPNFLPPSPPAHSGSLQSLPSDISLYERESEVVEGRKHIESNHVKRESSGSASPVKEINKPTLKQKVAHIFGELKRSLKNENWKPVPQDLINGVRNNGLRQELSTRNEKIVELGQLKERANILENKLANFDKKYAKSLALYAAPENPPKKGKFPAPDGKTYDFSKGQFFGDRAKMLNEFKAAFDKDPDFQSYNSDLEELRSIEGNRDEPGKRAELKKEIRELNKSLKPRVDAEAGQETELRLGSLDAQVEIIQMKTSKAIEQKTKEYRKDLKTLKEAVESKRKELDSHRMDNELRKFKISGVKRKLGGIENSRQRWLDNVDSNTQLNPQQKQQSKARIEASFNQKRVELQEELKSLESMVSSYQSEKQALQEEYDQAIEAREQAAKRSDFKESINEILRGQQKEMSEILELRKAFPGKIERDRAAIRKSLQGRIS